MSLSNPGGAYGGNTAYGLEGQMAWIESFALSGSVVAAAGDTVTLVYDATAKTLKVEPWDTNASGQTDSIGVGVAIDPITTNGKAGRVVLAGFAEVNVASGTAAEGSLATGSTTKGVAVVTAADATTVVGTTLGVFLGVKNASNRAPIWVGRA